MPKLEPKVVQRELDQGQLWPVYWLYGQERMKSRELLRRIRRVALGLGEAPDSATGPGAQAGLPEGSPAGLLGGLNEETLDGAEVDGGVVLDAARSLALGGGIRFIVVREAHALKGAEALEPLMSGRSRADQLSSVCVFLSRDLDGRRKFSRLLLEKAAVVPCEEVSERDREAWIGYLAKRRGVALDAGLASKLIALDPWSLDIIDLELEKLELSGGDADAVQGSGAGPGGADEFLDAFFTRDLKTSLRCIRAFAEKPDESLPLLGLFGWNVRQLALVVAARRRKMPPPKLNPYVADRIQAWARKWTLAEVVELQEWLEELDFSLKQRPLLPLGLWSSVALWFRTPRREAP